MNRDTLSVVPPTFPPSRDLKAWIQYLAIAPEEHRAEALRTVTFLIEERESREKELLVKAEQATIAERKYWNEVLATERKEHLQEHDDLQILKKLEKERQDQQKSNYLFRLWHPSDLSSYRPLKYIE